MNTLPVLNREGETVATVLLDAEDVFKVRALGRPLRLDGRGYAVLNVPHPTISGRYSTTWDWREADVVYCDPPYASTQDYRGTGEFDTQKFWEYMALWADHGAHVYVSEYEAPSGWVPIWDKPHRMSLTTTEQGRPQRTERLWRRA